MPSRKKFLLTVTTYPLPSRSYDELVCSAGVLEDGSWIRVYPVPLSFLMDLKSKAQLNSGLKYTWFELDLERRKDDFRPESFSPLNRDFRDLKKFEHLDTASNWALRKQYCLANVYDSIEKLLAESRQPTNRSLATYKPKRILGLDMEKDDEDWKDTWKALREQYDLFAPGGDFEPKKMIPKVPYKFFYRFLDENDKERRLMIEDWEIGALYWNCLYRADGDEKVALQKVREKYEGEFLTKNDVHLFLGTTLKYQRQGAPNPFVIIGVFYPRKELQLGLF